MYNGHSFVEMRAEENNMRKDIFCNEVEAPAECKLTGRTRIEVAALHKACIPALIEECREAWHMGFFNEGVASLIIVKLDDARYSSITNREEQDDIFYAFEEGMALLRDCGYRQFANDRQDAEWEREAFEKFKATLHDAHVEDYEWELRSEAEAGLAEIEAYNDRLAFWMAGGVPEWRAKQEIAREDAEEAERQAQRDEDYAHEEWLRDNFTERQLDGPY